MRYFIPSKRWFEEISWKEGKEYATFFGADSPEVLAANIRFAHGPSAEGSNLTASVNQLAKPALVRVCGPCQFKVYSPEVIFLFYDFYSRGREKYLETKIVGGGYCYSWVAGATIVSFEIIQGGITG